MGKWRAPRTLPLAVPYTNLQTAVINSLAYRELIGNLPITFEAGTVPASLHSNGGSLPTRSLFFEPISSQKNSCLPLRPAPIIRAAATTTQQTPTTKTGFPLTASSSSGGEL